MYVSNVSSSRACTKFDFVVYCRPRSCLRYVVWRSGRGCGLTLCVWFMRSLSLSLSLYACRKRAQSVSRLKVFECDRICVWVCVCLCLQPESINTVTPSPLSLLSSSLGVVWAWSMHCLPQFDKHLAWPSTATQKQFILRITLYVCYVLYVFFLPFVTVGSDIIHATQPEPAPPHPTCWPSWQRKYILARRESCE